MQRNIIPILSEQNENNINKSGFKSNSLRLRAIAEMCSRYNMIPEYVDGLTDTDLLVVLPTTQKWFDRVYDRYRTSRLIIKGNPEVCARYNVSIIGENTADEAEQIISYLKAANRSKVAIFAPHKANFESICYINTFLPKAALYGISIEEADVYWNFGRLSDCYDAFLQNHEKYNSMLCYNTQAAIYFCARAKEDGICIPEDLFIISRGEKRIAEAVHPSITTISLNEIEVGYQIVKLYRYLQRNPYVKGATVLLHSKLIPRESTANFPLQVTTVPAEDTSFLSKKLIGEQPYLEIMQLETMLNACSETDIRLLQGLRSGLSREKLAEQEFITASTVRYRLKRIFQHAGVENRDALFALIDKYNIDLETLAHDEKEI